MRTTAHPSASTASVGRRRTLSGAIGRLRRPGAGLTVAAVAFLLLAAALSGLAMIVPFAGSPTDVVGSRLSPPSWSYPLGTDSLGRSLLPRLIEGIGVTLVLSASAVVVAATVSTVVGMIAGYLGGWVKELTLRLADVFYAFPSIILAILLAAVLGAGRIAIVSAIVLVTVPLMLRMVCAATMNIAHRDYVTSALISGISNRRIIFRHILTGISGTIAVQGTYSLSVGILVEGGLSFLGQGVQIPQSSLGLLVQEGATYMIAAPWLLFAPAAALVLSILAVTVAGDGLRDHFEPRAARRLS
ncbi:ABC transporter permease [Brevibacterium aurantiacum]|uniref:ABC transporter permease n=2 Tax=Brevibacterium aurantiacum TaxID=273384 RepID=A0A2A3YV70_BREAU|nr:ABC transporter permease [Brevibacterium aurantiacum]RCS86004.1 ABC transporter permease [Brevibacterium aurantiacum]